MVVIKKPEARGKKAFISEEEFRGNDTAGEDAYFKFLEREVLGLGKLYWMITGATGGAIGILVIMLCVIKCLCKAEDGARSNPAGVVVNNTFVTSEQEQPPSRSRMFRDSFRWKKIIMEDPFQMEPPSYAEAEEEAKPVENTLRRKTIAEQQAEALL